MILRTTSRLLAIKCLSLTAFGLLASCSTGIEGTKTIKMSKEERRLAADSPEDILASKIRPQPLVRWKPGKRFLVTDDKAQLVYQLTPVTGSGEVSRKGDVTSGGDSLLASSMTAYGNTVAGRIVSFKGVDHKVTPGGDAVTVIRFSDGGYDFSYDTGRNSNADSLFTSLDLPMFIDLDLVSLADSLLKGKELWTDSRLWYDENGNKISGEKFRKVRITHATPGDTFFPLRVWFADESDRKACMFMNVSSGRNPGVESRTFPSLFMLEDPRLKYQSVTPEFWKLICRGEVAIGMTKEECRLALGNPTDVLSGHDWDSLLDVWSYQDGSYLQFQDGLLVKFRN